MSSSKRTISAIDAIYEILDKIEVIESRQKVIDNNIKLVNNKIAKLSDIQKNKVQKTSVTQTITAKPVSNIQNKTVYVHGEIKDKKHDPIIGVMIKVFTAGGEIMFEGVTNEEGRWGANINPGQYSVEYKHKRFRPINRNIKVPDNVKEYKVK